MRADPQGAFARDQRAWVQAELGLALERLGLHQEEKCVALRASVAYWEGQEQAGRVSGEARPGLEKSRAIVARCPPGL